MISRLDSIYDLLNNLKEIANGTQKASSPMTVDFAVVTKVTPLELDFGEFKVEEDDELFVISNRMKMLQKGKVKLKVNGITNEYELLEDENEVLHKLKEGDPVICLQEAGGEGWVVIDKVEVEDDE